MSAFVVITRGGRRFHADLYCAALAAGRRLSGRRRLERLYRPEQAAREGFTACRVCVPPALALPPTGETYGHEPVRGFLADRAGERLVCARCETAEVRSYWRDDAETVLRRWTCRSAVEWPCMSAVVLGLVVTDADRWNARYPVGSQVRAWPASRADKPLRTRTRTPAWRLAHGASVVSVDGHAGGILLTHVEAL